MTNNMKPNYYSNPAFCQQSEFYNAQRPQRALSPQRNVRQSPLGAQAPLRILDTSMCEENPSKVAINENGYEEQEFYEEILVDDTGIITDKKVVVIAQNNEGKKYIQNEDKRQGSRYCAPPQHQSRYESPQKIEAKKQLQRYEYIPMQEQETRFVSSPKKIQYQEEKAVEVVPGRVHRYAVIETEEETELTTKNGRYALVPVEELNTAVTQNRSRYEYIQENSPRKPTSNRYEYIRTPPRNQNRYDYIPEQRPILERLQQQQPQQRVVSNPVATQKLHELLSTPKKSTRLQHPQQQVLSPQAMRRCVPPPISPIAKTTPQRLIHAPKAQQKLNYALGTRQMVQEKRHTAIVAPMCSSPVQSVYSETTFSKSESWMNLSVAKAPVQKTLAIAAVMMLMCGAVTTGLCFYMISIMGRLYYLDFSIVAGFACLILGFLGFRTRNCYWLPNRNYISGYLVLSIFSLLTCIGLLVLLVMQPRPGSPLADMTSGAVCGISGLSLVLAFTGVMSSYCCKSPPPDNRVQHCAQGFVV